MGFLDTLLGRTRPKAPDLDQLFALPSAAVTLRTSTQFRPSGQGSVAFKAAEGGAFTGLTQHIADLLALDQDRFTMTTDTFGYTWLTRAGGPDDLEGLVTDLHAVNTSLVESGYGTALLCTLVAFTDGDRPLGLIYLYKRGTWYPFAPAARGSRDTALELEVKAVLMDDLRIEPELGCWFPIYGAPGL